MGNTGSNRRQQHHETHPHQPPPTPQPRSMQQHQMNQSQYVFAAATPYPPHYQNRTHNHQPYQHYPGGYYPAMPLPGPGPYDFHHYPGGRGVPTPPPVIMPYVEHQKAVTIRNDVNVKKETLRVEPDEENPGKFVVAFTFDATAPGSITVMFFAKEGLDCNLIATKEELFRSIIISFEAGIGQKFRQPSGAGIDFSMFDEAVLGKESDTEVFPLIVKAEARPLDNSGSDTNPTGNSQITMKYMELGIQLVVRLMRTNLEKNVSYACQNHGTQQSSHADTCACAVGVQRFCSFRQIGVPFADNQLTGSWKSR
ncbi:hypothetical protein LWI28_014028 [Acer negundo]|uniref:RING-type E3 ubiquitin transferase n=1 Tax=Acer negundo TaxID=4023 RepID=A0AAD5JLD6_ACENE|nr:hypothetical protein LWI28_014028 [Acer negundo]